MAAFYVLLIILSILSMFPFVWTLVSSGKEVSEDSTRSLLRSEPASPKFVDNYVQIWTQVPFGRWLFNSFFVTFAALVGTVISASLVGYSFARFRYPGRDVLFLITPRHLDATG